MASVLPNPKQQYFDGSGNPLSGGKVYTYEVGTSTPKATTDSNGATNSNPIILNSRGEADVRWTGMYKVVVKDEDDNTIYSVDKYGSHSPEFVSVKSYGAIGDGDADDTAAIQEAIDALEVAGRGSLYFPAGLYKVTAPLTVNGDFIEFVGDGARTSVIRVHHDSGTVVKVEHASAPGASFVYGFGMHRMGIRARQETTANQCIELNKVGNCMIDNVSLEDHFGGIHIKGGIQHHYSNIQILSARSSSPVNWSAEKVGSFFLKTSQATDGSTPAEIFVTNFNFRRNETVNYVSNGVHINAVDGLWLGNGHIMGVANACMYVNPVNGTEQITGIKCANVWFDGNSDYGIQVTGATTGPYGRIEIGDAQFLSQSDSAIFVDSTASTFEGIRVNGGCILKPANDGALLRAGARHIFNGVEFGACNTSAAANRGGVVIDNANADKVQIVGCTFAQTALGVTAASMIGVRVNTYAISQVLVSGCEFDLASGALDVSDSSTLDANMYPNNSTTKTANATAVAGTSLTIPEIGDVIYVSGGLNFDNMTGRWDGRRVMLVFAGVSTVTHGIGGIRLEGSVNFTSKAGDTLTLGYEANLGDWVQSGRMVS